jgi:hypothetical protein
LQSLNQLILIEQGQFPNEVFERAKNHHKAKIQGDKIALEAIELVAIIEEYNNQTIPIVRDMLKRGVSESDCPPIAHQILLI